MLNDRPNTIFLKDYKPSDYRIDTVRLEFDLAEDEVRVRSRLAIECNFDLADGVRPLVLDGQDLELTWIALDGAELAPSCYEIGEETLALPPSTLAKITQRFNLEIETRIKPQENTSLEGLYKSSGNFCTQCEAEGFRKITYFLDRPDVMARYTTKISADHRRYPVLLSNGNLADRGELPNGRHWVRWEDPYRKPSYLFALVAGDLVTIEDRFVTNSGREIRLLIYVEERNVDKCEHAMRSLQKAMRWDEETFGLEYDLDIYMIVAVDDFNMGAMENKGLNVFNSKYVLAKPDSATDTDYANIEGVIGHEYFHNWTGNRVTCRDWFQLSLKEGLTVFRDQQFSADMTSRAVKRIEDVRVLRSYQFVEDAGPLAHPVRPDSYMEINNFYTLTVYNKGAEIIRMYHTLLGAEGFRKGMDLYFERHDGQAVTTDDFAQAMQDANGYDLSQFKRWYTQAGTPELTVRDHYEPKTGVYSLTVHQSCPATPGQHDKRPFHIPLAIGLLDPNGKDIALRLEGESEPWPSATRVMEVRSGEETFRFCGVAKRPVPSLLRGFSAPVKLDAGFTDQDLAFLMAHDSDPFNRWDAGQQLAVRTMLKLAKAWRGGEAATLDEGLLDGFVKTLQDEEADPGLLALALTLPSETYVAQSMAQIDVEGIHYARSSVRKALAAKWTDVLLNTYEKHRLPGPYRFDPATAGRRSLKNACLGYLLEVGTVSTKELAMEQFRTGNNMTDVVAALQTLADHDCPQRQQALEEFYDRWQNDPLVTDKWFSIQALSRLPGTLKEVQRLMDHPAFTIDNPNRVRSLIGAFCSGNPVRFHDASGEGYSFLTDHVLRLDTRNSQVAARLLSSLTRWQRYDSNRQALMKTQLERILATAKVSKDVYEIASKSLA